MVIFGIWQPSRFFNTQEIDKDEERDSNKFFGSGINQPSLVRALHALDTIGLIKFVDNPFDNRMKSIGLTQAGKKMQYVLMGSNKVYPDMDTAVLQMRKGSKSLMSS